MRWLLAAAAAVLLGTGAILWALHPGSTVTPRVTVTAPVIQASLPPAVTLTVRPRPTVTVHNTPPAVVEPAPRTTRPTVMTTHRVPVPHLATPKTRRSKRSKRSANATRLPPGLCRKLPVPALC